MSEAAHEAAAGLVQDAEDEAAAAEPEASSDPEAAAAEQVQQEAAPLDLDPQLPDDLAEFLDEPDFEAEAEQDETEALEEEETGEYVDPAVAEERRKRVAAEKKAAHYERLRLVEARGKWKGEIEKFFPFADSDGILASATSRRGALREAKRQQERMRQNPAVQRILADSQRTVEEIAAAAQEEARAETADAWGKPLVGPAVHAAPAAAVAKQDLERKADRATTLADRIKVKLSGDLGERIA